MLRKARVKGLQFVLNTALAKTKHVALEKGNWGLREKLLRETQEMVQIHLNLLEHVCFCLYSHHPGQDSFTYLQ